MTENKEIYDLACDLAAKQANTDVFCKDCLHIDRGFLNFFRTYTFCKHPKVFREHVEPVWGIFKLLRPCEVQNRSLRCQYYEPKP